MGGTGVVVRLIFLGVFVYYVLLFGVTELHVEGIFNQSSYGRHLIKPPASKKGVQAKENKTLHYILQVAFESSDAEHVVSISQKKYGPSGFHTEKAINKYY